MRTERLRSKAALTKGNRDQKTQIIPKLGDGSLNYGKLTIIPLTTIIGLSKLAITIEEEHIEGDLNFPLNKF